MTKALLALEDGTIFWGRSIGAKGEAVGEVVFNTSMTGYQEILTDPSYFQQIVTLTYPHIGNVGVNDEDEESQNIMAQGLIIRDCPKLFSNFRGQQSLSDYLRSNNIIGIADIDTRMLTRILRKKGSQSGILIAADNINTEEAVQKAKSFGGIKGLDLAKAYAYSLGSHRAGVLESSFVAEVKSDLMGEQTILCGVLQTASILLF